MAVLRQFTVVVLQIVLFWKWDHRHVNFIFLQQGMIINVKNAVVMNILPIRFKAAVNQDGDNFRIAFCACSHCQSHRAACQA